MSARRPSGDPLPIRFNKSEFHRIDLGRATMQRKLGLTVSRSSFIRHAVMERLKELGIPEAPPEPEEPEADTPESAGKKAKAARAVADLGNGGHDAP